MLGCIAASPATPLLGNGPPRSLAQEQANKLTALGFHHTLWDQQDPRGAADSYLATDFRNHDIEQPSGARAYAGFFLSPAEYGNPNPPPTRPASPQTARRLFAITDGDLTLIAGPGPGPDPGARFGSTLLETRNGRVTQMWSSGADPEPSDAAGPQAGGATLGGVRLIVPAATATSQQRAANKAVVERFIQDFFIRGDRGAAARDLAPDLISHVPGVPSGPDFALVARKHPDKVVAPDAHQELFALADGDLVAIGFPVPYAGDPGARYAQSVVRLRDGKISEWWYSGPPPGRAPKVWRMPKG